MRQPPENSDSARFCAASSKPRPARMRAARAGAAWASMSTSRVWISAMRSGRAALSASCEQRARARRRRRARSRSAFAAPPGASCSTRPSRVVPRQGDRAALRREVSPAIRRKSVVLPAPLRPTRPTARRSAARRSRCRSAALAEPKGEVVDMQAWRGFWPASRWQGWQRPAQVLRACQQRPLLEQQPAMPAPISGAMMNSQKLERRVPGSTRRRRRAPGRSSGPD